MKKTSTVFKILSMVVVVIVCCSCVSSFYLHPEGGFRPKEPNFSLAKNKLLFNTNIDTMAVYIHNDTLKVGENDKYQIISLLKFYNNGCFMRNSIDIKDKIDRDYLIPSHIGYYQINKNNIKSELFDINLKNGKSKYIQRQGIIKGDSIILDSQFIEGGKDIYIKQKVDFVAKPANW